MSRLPVKLAAELAGGDDAPRWLIEGLWAEGAVGVLGGEPKCCKSFLALDAAVAVAGGCPCLGSFGVARRGAVLVYPAEDSLAVVHRRLQGLAAARGTSLEGLPLHVITAPRVLLDRPDDRRRLADTVEAIAPALLVLDPFIRLHRIDENVAAEVAPILSYLRELQRAHGVAVMLVHHARKDARGARPGQALRGSSDLHGWGDSNLYLRRTAGGLFLNIEHRAAPGRDDVPLELAEHHAGPALRLREVIAAPPSPAEGVKPTPQERILAALAALSRPVVLGELRGRCAMRTTTLCAALAALIETGRVQRTDDGRYALAA